MSAAGALQRRSRQKPRFLPAGHGAMSAEIAPRIPSWQKPRFLPAAQRNAAPNSAEIAFGDFRQWNIIRALFTAEDP
jgi:hypothetical protein